MIDPRLIRLRALLQKALEIEFFTLPPYMCALYSIPEGENSECVQVLQGVVMEEMLHVALVANVLNAVGGEPRISPRLSKELTKCFYPSRIPHIDLKLEVSLQRFSPSAVETFMAIEAPERPEEWLLAASRGDIQSIGHFYNMLLDHLVATANDLGENAVFSGNPNRQLRAEHYYGGGGGLLPVGDLVVAKDIIEQVAQQGEGRRQRNLTGDQERFGQPKEVAHYYRFKQLSVGRYYDRDDEVTDPTGPLLLRDWTAVFPMRANPRLGESLPQDFMALWTAFDNTYGALLDGLHRAFNGDPCAIRHAVPAMHRLRHEAAALMKVPRGDGTTLGTPLWFVQLS
jgi:hypothetical protein